MQPPQLLNSICSWPVSKMVRVTQDQMSLCTLQLLHCETFDGAYRNQKMACPLLCTGTQNRVAGGA